MLLLADWLQLCLLSHLVNHAFGSFKDSYDSKLLQLPQRLRRIVPDGLPVSLLNFYAPIEAESEACLRDAKLYYSSLQTFQPWAVQMMDSSSKIPSGIMEGHIHDLGNYDQCVSVSAPHFTTKHCLVDIIGLVPEPRLVNPHLETVLGGMPLLKEPKLSICLPSSCTREDVSQHFSRTLAPFNITAYVGEYSCSPSSITTLDTLDWTVLTTVCIWFSLMLASSVYDLFHSPKVDKVSTWHSVLVTLSVISNGRKLFSSTDPSQPWAYLGGVRFISMVWVLLGHHTLMQILTPALNWIDLYKEVSDPWLSVVLNALLAVVTFQVLTGTLTAYFFLREIGTNGRQFSFSFFYLHRIIRLWPTLLVTVMFAATLTPLMGDGPLWPTFFTRQRDVCRANGWTNLLFLNNYIEADNQCCSHTWYLCVDLHLFLLSPLVLFPLLKSRHFAHFGMPLLIVAAVLVDFLVCIVNKLPAGSFLARDLRTADNYRLEYVPTHTRISPWLVGLGLGYILHSVDSTKVHISKVMLASGWTVSTALMLGSLVGVSYFHQDSQVVEYSVLSAALYTSLHRVAWALGVAWVLFVCHTGNAEPVRKMLSCRVFQPLGRLSFSLYMISPAVQYIMVASTRVPAYYSPINTLKDVLGELMLSIVHAILLSLAVEAPFIHIEKLIMQCNINKYPELRTGQSSLSDGKINQSAITQKNVQELFQESFITKL